MKLLEFTLLIILIDEALTYSVLSNASKTETSQLNNRQRSSCSYVLQEMLNRENQKHGEQITKLQQTLTNLNNEISQLAENQVQSKNELLSLRMDQLLFSKAFNESLKNIEENQTIWGNQLVDISTKLDILTDSLESIMNNMHMFGIESAKTNKELTNMNDDINQIRKSVKNEREELSYLREDYLNFSNTVNEQFEHLWYNQSAQDVQLSRIHSHVKSASTDIQSTTTDTSYETSTLGTTDIQSTTTDASDQTSTLSTTDIQSTTNDAPDQTSTLYLKSTKEVPSTPIVISDQSSTKATTDIQSTTNDASDQTLTLYLKSTTEVSSTLIVLSDQSSTIATTDIQSKTTYTSYETSTLPTPDTQSTTTDAPDQTSTSHLKSTTEVPSTLIVISDQSLTIATTDIQSTTTDASDQTSTLPSTDIQSTTTDVSDQTSTLPTRDIKSTTTDAPYQTSSLATTYIQSTTNDAPDQTSTLLTTDTQSTTTDASDQTSILWIQSTAEVRTTPISIYDQNSTIGSRGRKFVVLFTHNIASTTKSIYVTSEKGVQINMSTSPFLDSWLRSQIDKSINIPSSQKIIIPSGIELTSFIKEFKSIQIETSDDAFVIGHDRFRNTYSVGTTTHIPVHKLSTRYVVVSVEPDPGRKSQFALAAIKGNTSISITFKMKRDIPMYIDGKQFYNHDVFNLTLNNYETYQIEHDTDLTGTVIESTYPIAIFSGNDCTKVENIGACDHIIEQLPPLVSVDNTYIVPPHLDGRDTLIRITATEECYMNYTKISISSGIHLDMYETYDIRITSDETCAIESASPILVTSFGLYSILGDPSMTIVPGIHQYLNYYKMTVPSGYTNNYVSIIIVESSKNAFRINGVTVYGGDIMFEKTVNVRNTAYNVRSIRVTEGELTAETVDGERFGLMIDGVDTWAAYGFSGNSLLL